MTLRHDTLAWYAGMLLAIATPAVSFAAVTLPNTTRLDDRMTNFHFHRSFAYTIRPGDTLWTLSEKLGVPVVELMVQNNVRDPRFLQIGMTLKYDPAAALSGDGAAQTQNIGLPALTSRSTDGVFLPRQARVLFCTLTAYTAGYESTGKHPGDPGYGITSTGARAEQGLTVAVDPSIIPYGTKLYIPGIGFRIAEDTGGAITGNHIDVFVDGVSRARRFGVQPDKPVYILPGWYPLPQA